jgi:poly(hydroxyalkanoate) granule-associated protein
MYDETMNDSVSEPSGVPGAAAETVSVGATDAADVGGGPIEQMEGPVRRAMLAGIGAVALFRDGAQQTFDRLVDRGEQVQTELEERAERVRRRNAGTSTRVRESFRGAMDAFLDALNVPNKADVDTINVKLNILSRKLDDIQMQQVRSGTPGQPDRGTPGSIPPDTDQAT